MSSPRFDAILRTRVFQLTLAACGGFVLLALAAIWLWSRLLLWQIADEEIARIQDIAAFAEDVYYGDGTLQLTEELSFDGDLIWSDAQVQEIFDAEEDLLVLRDVDFEPLAGAPGLYGEEELTVTYLDHPQIDTPVRALFVPLRGGESITVGRFLPGRETDIRELASVGALVLIAIALPLALVTGYFLARAVFRRLAPITATAEAVAAGTLSERAPETGAGDEFDRLASGSNRMLDQIESLTRNIEGVTVGVAHDLKTPLANIGGRLELIGRDAADPAAVAAHAQKAEAHLGQLLRIFDALLRLGEIEAGKRREAFRPLDLSALAAEMADSYAPLFEEADKGFLADIAPGRTVTGDPDLLTQLIANLLDNALEHSRDAAKVTLTLTGSTLTVADDGPGIPAATAAQIFEKFYRADASRSRPGNGLGLALVKAIADLHHAEVTVEAGGPGARFDVTFSDHTIS